MRLIALPPIAVILAAFALTPLVPSQGEILATTSLGPITTADLEGQVQSTGIPGDDFGTVAADRHVERLLEWEARDQIALKAIDEQTWGEEAELLARLMDYWEGQFLRLGEPILLPRRAPAEEEIRSHLEEHGSDYALPDLVTWRHMRFEEADSPRGSSANARAQAALEALASGEAFAAVAERLATPPQESAPGAIIGPMPLLDAGMIPEIAQALRSIPLGTPSEPIETSVGLVIVEVLDREIDRMPPESRLTALARERRVRADFDERRAALLSRLRAENPVEISAELSPEMPGDTPALRLGERTLTLEDLRVRAANEFDPQSAFLDSLTVEAREELADRLLLIQEIQRRNLITDAQMDLMEWTARSHRARFGFERLFASRQPVPTEDDLEAHLREHQDRFLTDLVSYEALIVPREVLSALASSELGLRQIRAGEDLRARMVSGESVTSIQRSLGVPAQSFHQGVAPVGTVPAPLADIVSRLQPGEVSAAAMRPEGLILVRLVDRHVGIPPREMIQRSLVDAWIAENGIPSREFLPMLLAEYDFQILVDPSRLAFGENGQIIVQPSDD